MIDSKEKNSMSPSQYEVVFENSLSANGFFPFFQMLVVPAE